MSLRITSKPRSYIMSMMLLLIISIQILYKKRSRANYSHVALEDVEQFREFIEACAAEELAVSIQANIVWEQVAIGVLFVRHRAELDELEDFFVKARARLRKERIALHLDGAEDGEHEQQRAQAEDGCQSTEEVEGAFEVTGVHIKLYWILRFAQDDEMKKCDRILRGYATQDDVM